MVGAAIGAGVALYGASSSASASGKASDNAKQAAQNQLDFATQQYGDWKAVFGDLETNLSNYYKNLSPEMVTAQGLEQYNSERDTSLTTVRQTLAQRGLATSGIAAGVETSSALQSAADRAKIRADAPMKVAQQQSQFLALGLNQQGAATNSINNALSQQTSAANSQAATAASNAGQAVGAATSAVSDFISNADFLKSKPVATTTPASV